MRVRLDPTLARENGNTPTFVSLVSGGSGEGYWKTETGARWVWITNATFALMRLISTSDPNPYGQPTYPNQISYRVNGEDFTAGRAELGDGTYKMFLPEGFGKTVELFVPVCNIIVFGGPVVGSFPVDIEFNDVATAVAVPTSGDHLGILGDSIDTGMNSIMPILRGWVGELKRGYSDQFLPATSPASKPRFKGAYAADATYAVNDVVTDAGFTWLKRTTAPAGTTPAVGANWYARGKIGRVTNMSHGTARLYDWAATSGAQTATASFIASKNLTQLVIKLMSNDYVTGFATPTAYRDALVGLLNALAATSSASLPVVLVSALLTSGGGSREVANGAGYTLDDFRATLASVPGLTSKSNVTVVDGKAMLTSDKLADGLHPTTAGQIDLRQKMQPYLI